MLLPQLQIRKQKLQDGEGDTMIIRARVESVGVWPIVISVVIVIIVVMSRHTREEGTGAK